MINIESYGNSIKKFNISIKVFPILFMIFCSSKESFLIFFNSEINISYISLNIVFIFSLLFEYNTN